ncbi:MAG: hypothetical protein RIR48_481 [Bacteroidota bacterium]
MKKYILSVMLMSCFASTINAQLNLPKEVPTSSLTNFIKPPSLGDVGKTSKGITDMLGSKLSLPSAQIPKLNEAVSGFLGSKKNILGLADKNPTEYLTKFAPLQKDLFSKMKGIMGPDAFGKLLGMKPSGSNIGGNLLSNLFF